jgi:hypothetical protein
MYWKVPCMVMSKQEKEERCVLSLVWFPKEARAIPHDKPCTLCVLSILKNGTLENYLRGEKCSVLVLFSMRFYQKWTQSNGTATTIGRRLSLSSHICFTSSDVFLHFPVHNSKPNQPCCFKSMWYGGTERIKYPYQTSHHQYGVCDSVTGTCIDQNKFRVQGSKMDCPAVPTTTACPVF